MFTGFISILTKLLEYLAGMDKMTAYKAVVKGNDTYAWRALVSMGRPMWKSAFNALMVMHGDEMIAAASVVDLAARKLLLGRDFCSARSYANETTMFGVASMLCPLGLRQYSKSVLGSRVIADFMAVLAYVNFKGDGQLSSYSSDPVLALGAWYAAGSPLSKYMIPQLRMLLTGEALDTGGMSEVVARIVLLLAMDSCVVKGTKSQGHATRDFMGQFVSVRVFMDVLVGPDPPLKVNRLQTADQNTKIAFDAWQDKWDDWQLRFSHFVQLMCEPTEETLWVLLGRRAAGILPRNHSGVNLVISIFHREKCEVSVMLVQVKDLANHDPESARDSMSPHSVFSEKNSLRMIHPCDAIRLDMGLREDEEQFVRCESVNMISEEKEQRRRKPHPAAPQQRNSDAHAQHLTTASSPGTDFT
ncbi:unnamed protein product [Phytophthora lilii]|uniref:Unnamed protein product n=1 Tax=Phytophthora lilii TaxID=2077276 RepID=A0A9W7D985_9STRA|nr:unnamed protein product [Phytophthora lilii]